MVEKTIFMDLEQAKEELKALKFEKEKLIGDMEEFRRKMDGMRRDAERDARNIMEKAESENASLNHVLSEREKAVSKAEEIYGRQQEHSDEVNKAVIALNEARKQWEEERKNFESEKSRVSELETLAKLMMEQATTIAKERGIILEEEEMLKEDKEEKKKKKKE